VNNLPPAGLSLFHLSISCFLQHLPHTISSTQSFGMPYPNMSNGSAIYLNRGESQSSATAELLVAESQHVDVPIMNHLASNWAWDFGETALFFFADPLFEATTPVSLR